MHPQFDTQGQNDKIKDIREKEEEDLMQMLASKHSLTYTDLSVVPVNTDALRLVVEDRARAGELVTFDKLSKQVSLALHNPSNPVLAEIEKELVDRGFKIKKFLVSKKSLDRAYEFYKDIAFAYENKEGMFDISKHDAESFDDLASFRAFLTTLFADKKQAQTSRAFEQIASAALALKASDIHIEPEEHDVRLRLRLDGMLTDAFTFTDKQYKAIASRIKLLSGLKLNVDNRAQDGRFTIAIKDSEIEIRTSVIPGAYGESFVLRILDPKTIQRSFEDMGVHPKLLERLRKEIRRPNGLLLNTGPTGSGKTTTLYTFMRDVHHPDIKIVTIEDPIEYHVPGIVQTQVDGTKYTFASGLRSVLRQDPDIIMVGEIRDKEVADTAIQAALTGHFVFSTLHTNNAAGSFPRLIDLGVDPKLFASAVTVSMAQRLVRTLNDKTKKARPATEAEKKMMEAVMSTIADKSLIPTSYETVYDPAPQNADDSGYKGRMGIHEAIFMDEELGTFLRDNPSEGDIQKNVIRQGYPTLAQDGILKVLQGKTSIDELKRVVDLPE